MQRIALERADLSVFEELSEGDIVFLDGSHRTFMNSDATVFFLEVLPALPAGVLVGVHDIFLPYDYPAELHPAATTQSSICSPHTFLAGRCALEAVLPAAYAAVRCEPDLADGASPPRWSTGWARFPRHRALVCEDGVSQAGVAFELAPG